MLRPVAGFLRSSLGNMFDTFLAMRTLSRRPGVPRYLHDLAEPILHQDLKPENVLIFDSDSKLIPKVTDSRTAQSCRGRCCRLETGTSCPSEGASHLKHKRVTKSCGRHIRPVAHWCLKDGVLGGKAYMSIMSMMCAGLLVGRSLIRWP